MDDEVFKMSPLVQVFPLLPPLSNVHRKELEMVAATLPGWAHNDGNDIAAEPKALEVAEMVVRHYLHRIDNKHVPEFRFDIGFLGMVDVEFVRPNKSTVHVSFASTEMIVIYDAPYQTIDEYMFDDGDMEDIAKLATVLVTVLGP